MEKETYKTNPSIDVRNRRELNRQNKNLREYKEMQRMKAPESPDKYLSEATQTINPLTGKVYDFLEVLSIKLDIPVDFWYAPLDSKKKKIEEKYFNWDKERNLENYFKGAKGSAKPETNEFIEYQFALAKMDIRDGKMGEEDYLQNRENIRTLVERMNKAEIPISLIHDIYGFNEGLKPIEDEFLSKQLGDTEIPFVYKLDKSGLPRFEPRDNLYINFSKYLEN